MPKKIFYPSKFGPPWDSFAPKVLPQAWGTRPDAQMPWARARQVGRHLETSWDSLTAPIVVQFIDSEWFFGPDRRIERSRRDLLAGSTSWDSLLTAVLPQTWQTMPDRQQSRAVPPRPAGLQVGWDSFVTSVLPQVWATLIERQQPRSRPRQEGLSTGWDSLTTTVLPQIWLTIPDRRIERNRRELLAGAIWITDQSVQIPPLPNIDWAALTRELPKRAQSRQVGLSTGWDSLATAVLPQIWTTLPDRQQSRMAPRQIGRSLEHGWDSLTAPIIGAVPDIDWPQLPDRRIERVRRDALSGPIWIDHSATAVYPATHTTLPEKAAVRPPRKHDGPLYTAEVSVPPPAAADAWATLPDRRMERIRRDILSGPLWSDSAPRAVYPAAHAILPDRAQRPKPRDVSGRMPASEIAIVAPTVPDVFVTLPGRRTERLRRDALSGPLWNDHRLTAVLPQTWQTMPDRQQTRNRPRQEGLSVGGWDAFILVTGLAISRTGGTVTSGGGSDGIAIAYGAATAATARSAGTPAQPR